MINNKYKVITHYHIDDESCSGDYWFIDIRLNESIIRTYGDAYHDRGREKVEGYFDALSDEGIAYVVEHYEVADAE